MTNNSGEIFILNTNQKENSITKNIVLWIFSGQVYQAPINSYLNYYTDHKINKNSYIFRTKLINQSYGSIKILNEKKNLLEQKIQLITEKYSFGSNCYIQKISKPKNNKNYVLNYKKLTYLIMKILIKNPYIRVRN